MKVNKELYEKIQDITGVDYGGVKIYDDILIPINALENIMKDLVVEYNRKVEELEEHKEHCREYHVERKINPYTEYGISEKDFH